ncbi:hypothetical protein QBC34DRAFT_412945 [Podospora aff. communis PSN243]|uniref:J domain-containing protein n=1 Tax=Podospora aff. communis PSN243 TaxID=3040156 RepID=A0AAV9GC15_9PEZI|nr:hypothetical protein QBC34DRAFT_412945 [Podospora aff. communis PSN243]
MGYFVGITGTGFVGSDEMSAVTSFQPCHIFGDQMLIGSGIRIGFYLLYGAGILAVLFGVDKQFRFWHGAWGILALSLFLSMFLNIASQSLVIIDYAVLIQLVLWYPVYFLFTVLFRQALVIKEKSEVVSDEEVRRRLQKCHKSTPINDTDIARARAYTEVLKAFALYAAAEDDDDRYEDAQGRLAQSVQHYVSHWHDQIEPRDGAQYGADGGVVTTVYNQDLIDEIAAAPTRDDVDKLRDLYVAALVHSELSAAEARATEQEVALIASQELKIKRSNRPAKHAFRHFLLTTSYKDQLTAAIGLLVWSMYMFGTAALNWPLLHNGNKAGTCDDFPTVYFVFAPKKPFVDGRFATFLKVWTVGVCIFAVFTTAVAIFILIVGIFGPSSVGLASWSSTRRRHKKNGKKSVEAGASDFVYDVRGSPGYSRRARGQHSQQILECLHHTESRTIQRRYRMRTTSPIRFSVWNIPWAILLAVLLVITITCAELTVRRQGPNNNIPLDFARPPLHETAEILALLIGLYSLVLTLLSIIGAIVSSVFRKRHSKSVTVDENVKVEDHHHHHKKSDEPVPAPAPEGEQRQY